jgi:hypothetical protein
MATDYQETTQMLGDLSWSGRHGCYVVFHVKLSLYRVRVPIYLYLLMMCDHPSHYLLDDE